MDGLIPWTRLVALIGPHYPKPGRGRRPLDLETMLRIYFLQQWFELSDPGAEDAIYDSESMRRFVGIELGEDRVPDESSVLHFRHLLEKHNLTKAIFEEIGDLLKEKGLILRQGTIVDVTIISAPSSTKNRAGKRDPSDALDEEGQPVVLRHEGPRGYGHAGTRAQPRHHRCGPG
jgi:IS5 family transposase